MSMKPTMNPRLLLKILELPMSGGQGSATGPAICAALEPYRDAPGGVDVSQGATDSGEMNWTK